MIYNLHSVKQWTKRALSLSLNISADVNRIREIPIGSSIPKVIYQTYPTKNLPPELNDNILRIRSINKDWQHVLFDNEDIEKFIFREYGKDILRSYLSIDERYGAARADLFRYLLIYNRGGCYLDIKSLSTKCLTDIIPKEAKYILSNWDNPVDGRHSELSNIVGGEFQQWHVIGVRGHPFLRAVLNNVLRNISVYLPSLHDVGKKGVLSLTGPIAYTLAIEKIKDSCQYNLLNSPSETGLVYSVFENNRSNSHLSVFNNHYSLMTHPIVNNLNSDRFLIRLLSRI